MNSHIVNGVQEGHQHLNSKNHASKGMEKTFEGKSMRLGGGGKFAKGKSELESKGYSEKSAGAIMASAGRKKYGASKMASMAAKGRSK